MSGESRPPRSGSRLRFILPVAVFALLALLFLVRLFAGDPSRLPSALIGRDAPATALPALDGVTREGAAVAPLSTTAWKGRVVVLNVFASWCVPCREEHPVLMQLAATPPFREGRALLAGLNYKDEGDNARKFLAGLGNPYGAIGVDRNGRAGIEWGVYGVPETFVIDRAGTIIHKQVGPFDAAGLARLNEVLNAALR